LTEEVERLGDFLTDEEKAILIQEFGDVNIEVTEAKSKNGFIVVRYEIGDYWAEYSYDENLGEELEFFMEQDRIKWLKDIVNKISEVEEPEEEIEDLLGDYSIL
jgi:tRNA(His) 5'-end guanylyltransferase